MENSEQKRLITVERWHEMAQTGADLPMCIPINGVSMMPLIRKMRDMVTIMPIRRVPVRGDIVMFADPGRKRYVLHRAWNVKDGFVQTWGDNCFFPDGWLPLENIWGLAVAMERDSRHIELDTDRARRRGLMLGRAYHCYIRARRPFVRLLSHLPRPVKDDIKKILHLG